MDLTEYWEIDRTHSILALDCGHCNSPFAAVAIDVLRNMGNQRVEYAVALTCMRCGRRRSDQNESVIEANRNALGLYGYRYDAPFPDPGVSQEEDSDTHQRHGVKESELRRIVHIAAGKSEEPSDA